MKKVNPSKFLPSRDLVLGAAIGAIFTFVVTSYFANRNEEFQLQQIHNERVLDVRADIHQMLAAVDERDGAAFEVALYKLKNSSLYLPEYQKLLTPLFLAAMQKKSTTQASYEIQSYDIDGGVSMADESILKELDDAGWNKIAVAAADVEIKLFNSMGQFSL